MSNAWVKHRDPAGSIVKGNPFARGHRNAFGDLVEEAAYTPAPCRIIPVTDEMRAKDAATRAARDKAPAAVWPLKAALGKHVAPVRSVAAGIAFVPKPKVQRTSSERGTWVNCPWCSERMVSSKLPPHKRACPARPADQGQEHSRRTVLRTCSWCNQEMNTTALTNHRPHCPQKPARLTPHTKLLRPCPYCQVEMGKLELDAHRPRCPQRPATVARGRKPSPKPCPFCSVEMTSRELQNHKPRCPQKPARLTRKCEKRKILRPCPYCAGQFGVNDLLRHKPHCERNPNPRIVQRRSSQEIKLDRYWSTLTLQAKSVLLHGVNV